MAREINADVCVIGAGSAGLTAAWIAAQAGARTVLIERGEMGGECLNTGCVPSKALLAAASRARHAETARPFGVLAEPRVDFARVHAHVHEVITAIAPHDSVERFEKLGVEVIREDARFVGARQLMAGDSRINARRVVIATGSAPKVPDIEGLGDVPYFTNETIFNNAELPEHLVVIGGGPLGIELAQAHRRLGSRVTVLVTGSAMDKDEPELAAVLLKRLAEEGVAIREKAQVKRIEAKDRGIVLHVEEAHQKTELKATHLLVATGRTPRLQSLELARADVEFDDKGISVDERLQTSAKGVYAVGDVVKDGPKFTHIAGYQAGIAMRNALLRWPAKVDYRALPWVTYTDPELAHTGMTEAKARKKHGDQVRVLCLPFAENDRAQAEREPEGMIKVVTRKNGSVLGASIVGAHAGEMIHTWVLAIEQDLRLKHVASMIAPYPTLGELNKQVASESYKELLSNPWVRRLVRTLLRLP